MTSVAQFRGASQKTPPLHPAEKLLVGILTLHLCFLPWALGTMHVWSQVFSFIFSVLGFAVSLWPRRYGADLSGDAAPFRLIMWPKLARFPIFWIGAVFLLYIGIQALNPAWRYVQNDKYWWLVRTSYIGWLPHGMETPFAKASPWRSLMIYGSAWLAVCSLWVGFTRRKSLRIFFVTLAANAFALALLGIAERGLHANKIFWTWQPPAGYFVSSFIYKNHAGAYFNLLLSLCAALAAWSNLRSARRLAKSSPSGLFVFFVIVLALIVIFSYSRAATLLMSAYLSFLLVLFLCRRLFFADRSRSNLVVLGLLCSLFGASSLLGFYFLPTGEAVQQMDALVKSYRSAAPDSRRLATQATFELFRGSPTFGWGAGSFRFVFPIYQQYYPIIYMEGDQRLYWEHAHDDYAELLAELGIVGSSMLVVGAVYYLVTLLRLHFWENPFSLLLFGGCMITLIHCAGDFNFFNPAILITWCIFWPGMIRWLEVKKFGE